MRRRPNRGCDPVSRLGHRVHSLRFASPRILSRRKGRARAQHHSLKALRSTSPNLAIVTASANSHVEGSRCAKMRRPCMQWNDRAGQAHRFGRAAGFLRLARLHHTVLVTVERHHDIVLAAKRAFRQGDQLPRVD